MTVRKLFGQFLIENGYVNEDDVYEALNFQKNRTLPIGEIALKKKKLTVKQVFKILNFQQKSPKRFGEIGVELGFLTSEDVDELLEYQQKSRPRLGDILVIRKVVSRDVMKSAMTKFFSQNAI